MCESRIRISLYTLRSSVALSEANLPFDRTPLSREMVLLRGTRPKAAKDTIGNVPLIYHPDELPLSLDKTWNILLDGLIREQQPSI